MKVNICKCKTCKAQKSTMKSKYKKAMKRYVNRLRRKSDGTKAINIYYA